WQKVLGGEGQHGILILGPRAVERINSHKPTWPMPKIFRLQKKGELNEGIFRGETINTPSMLAVEDYIDALTWAKSLGGLSALKARANNNLAALEAWVNARDWVDFLAPQEIRSNTSVCLKITDPRVTALSAEDQQAFIKRMTKALEQEEAAFDIAGYRAAPPGLRIWCGATIETSDIEALTPWLDWAFDQHVSSL
ncbi:MAG: phosphoserine aminotransferase, partial [Pseudomonadota bacterium]